MSRWVLGLTRDQGELEHLINVLLSCFISLVPKCWKLQKWSRNTSTSKECQLSLRTIFTSRHWAQKKSVNVKTEPQSTVIARCASPEVRTTRPIQSSSDWDVTRERQEEKQEET
jgi:hypothetical protein